MARAKKLKSVMLVGRRWFNRTHGNTYHSVEIWINGEQVGHVPYAYGYGDQYVYTGLAWMKENGYGQHDKESEPLYKWEERNGVKVAHTYTDVQRKKDL